MAEIPGTTGNDSLVGTSDDDTLFSYGGTDILSGRNGADIYALTQGSGGSSVTIEDMGTDGAIDTITGGRGLVASASLGYLGWATALRTGDDLTLVLPSKPSRFRKPGYGPLTIEIKDQYDGAPVELIVLGTKTYHLADSFFGSAENDILAGTTGSEVIESYGGDDFIDANGGDDSISTGDGADTVFAGDGDNVITTGDGNKRIFSGSGDDQISTGSGSDQVEAGDGDNTIISAGGNNILQSGDGHDLIQSGDGNDNIRAGDGNNTITSGAGEDTITTGAGDDLLIGGTDEDTYTFSSLGGGNDTIRDTGDAAIPNGYYSRNMDTVAFTNYPTLDAARHSVDIRMSGQDLVFVYWNINAPGVVSQITVQDHLAGDMHALERVNFGVGGAAGLYHIALLQGDSFTYSVHDGPDAGGTDIVLGTAGHDEIYGGQDGDIMIGGGGSDWFVFEDEEDAFAGTDIIMDFKIGYDLLDFREIKGLAYSGISISNSAYGNALISTAYGSVELKGISHLDVTRDMFLMRGDSEPNPVAVGVLQTGSSLNDTMIGTNSHDTLQGALGDDSLVSGNGNDLLIGDAGDDRAFDGRGNDTVHLGDGDDYARAGGGADVYDGGSGTDYISYYDSAGGVHLDFAANTATGSWANNDTVLNFEGASGSKTGDDTISGTDGANKIQTYGGDDRVHDLRGDDIVKLGSGDDYVRVGGGSDTYDGGSGTDYISYYDSRAGVNLNFAANTATGSWANNDVVTGFEGASGSNSGDDTISGTDGANILRGYGGDDHLLGRGGDDSLSGGTGEDSLFGGSGADTLRGGSGADLLEGGDGADVLDGGSGPGLDQLYGGADADEFHFDRGEGHDVIKDFENDLDTIVFDNFAYLATAADALTFASENGGDVLFDFGADGTLLVEHTTIAQLGDDIDIV